MSLQCGAVRVVHLITELDTGGAEVTLARLLEALAHRVESIVIVLAGDGPLKSRIERGGVPVIPLGMHPGRLSPIGLFRLARLLRRYRPDVLQTWLYHADFAGLIARTLAGIPKLAWNLRCSELDFRDHGWSMPALRRSLALVSRWPAVVVSNSEAGVRAHERIGYHPRRWCVIPNGLDATIYRPDPDAALSVRRELGIGNDLLLVGLFARFHPMKDHVTFLRAAAELAAQRSDVHFVAAGRGVDTNAGLRVMLQQLGLNDRVHLLPERADAARLFAALDVAVSSSYSEAFPNVVAEAMACGTPCVVTDVGDSAAIVGDTGIVVPPRNPPALAQAIERLLKMPPDERAALGLAARRRIVENYSLEQTATQYLELYLELAQGKAS